MTTTEILKNCGLDQCLQKKEKTQLDAHFLLPVQPHDVCKKSIKIKNIYELDSWLAWKGCVPHFENEKTNFENYIGIEKLDYDRLKTEIENIQIMQLKKNRWLGEAPEFSLNREVIFVEKVIIPKSDRLLIIGDIHCSVTSMLNILSFWYEQKWISNDFTLAPQLHLIFLGDIIDRGAYGTELITLMFLLKHANRDRVFAINGNHETCATFHEYGMHTEIAKKFGSESLAFLLQHMSFLQYQPSTIIVEYGNDRFQFSHGAFSPNLKDQANIDQLLQSDKTLLFVRYYSQNCKTLQKGDMDQQKWGDFIGTEADTTSLRGKNVKTFGWRSTLNYLKKLNITCIISGHQDLSNFTMLLSPFCSKKAKEFDPNYKTLYRPQDYGKKTFPSVVSYEPGKDFIAVNTSTALDSKGNSALQYDCFLLLKSAVY